MRRKDMLVKVEGYDLSRGVMLAVALESGQKLEVTIPSALSVRADKEWSGNSVDERMERALPVGTQVIIESAQGPKRSVGKDEPLAVSGRWVVLVPNSCARPDGVFMNESERGAIPGAPGPK